MQVLGWQLLVNFSILDVLHRSSLRVETCLDALSEVLGWFEQFKQNPIPQPIWLQCQLALAEGFTNVVRHAHRSLSAQTPIDLELVLYPDRLEIRIWDVGPSFDLEQFLKNLPPKPDVEAEGGRGLLMMKAIASHFTYTRQQDGRNCLYIAKRYADLLPHSF